MQKMMPPNRNIRGITHVKKCNLGADASRERAFRGLLHMLPAANFEGESAGVTL